jgi:hypothetical protein
MVYRLQGVDINDKHFEIIIKQMLRKEKGSGCRRQQVPYK